MKTKLTALALIVCVLFTGCATNTQSNPEQTARRIGVVAESAAFVGTTYYLQKHPDERPKFEAAYAAVVLLNGGTNASAAQLSEALEGLPIKELKGDQGALYVGSAMILYDAFLAENVSVPANVKPVVGGITRGMGRALGK